MTSKESLKILMVIVALILAAFADPQGTSTSGSPLRFDPTLPSGGAAQAWADSVMATLTPRQRVAQLVIPRLDVVDNEAGRAAMRRMVEGQEVGGVLLGKGTLADYAAILNYGQQLADVPLLVTLDGEWGLSMRVTDAPRFPYAMGLGAIQDPQALYEYGREVARECRETGIHVNFAPVMDVNSNPANPVIGYRSFGEDPERVAALGVAYSRGLEDGGVMAVAKHFPGHGDTSTDSHKELPTVDHSMETLRQVDLVPFQQFIDAGCSGVMVGHLKVPALDASGTPASLSKPVTTGLLKEEMGFRGLVFTDALAMKGANSAENNCVAALRAGVDVLLQPSSPATDIDAVMAAIKAGKISQDEIDRRCRKMLATKYALGLANYRPATVKGIKQRVNNDQAKIVNDHLAAASITAVKNDAGLLPLGAPPRQAIAVISIGAPADNEFSALCSKYLPVATYSVDKSNIPAATMQKLREADVVVAAVMSDAEWAQGALKQLTDLPALVPVTFVKALRMSRLGQLSNMPTLVAAYDDTPALRRAAAQAIFGGHEVSGRFPVNARGVASLGQGVTIPKTRLGYATPQEQGFDSRLEGQIDSIVGEAIREKAFPGCQVVVGRHGDIVLDKSYGATDYGTAAVKVTDATLYDIASMSKAIGTMGGLMKAYDEGLFSIDEPIASYIPELEETDKASIEVKELLYHQSGMPPVLAMYKIMIDSASYSGPLTRSKKSAAYPYYIDRNLWGNATARLRRDITSPQPDDSHTVEAGKGIWVGLDAYDTLMNRIHTIELKPDKRYRYSCLNFCLLMEMEENLTGVPHDEWVAEEIFAPLGALRTGYNPLEWYPRAMIAPTEQDKWLRRQHLQGYVHDELAAFSGGVQGNAGLFSTAGDVAKYCQMLLNRGTYGGQQILRPSTVDLFTLTKSPTTDRTLGFDMSEGTKSFSGMGASPSTYGHTGFTGTCFWIAPEQDLFMVVLTNRVNPSRQNAAFSRLNPRGAIWQAVYESLGFKPSGE